MVYSIAVFFCEFLQLKCLNRIYKIEIILWYNTAIFVAHEFAESKNHHLYKPDPRQAIYGKRKKKKEILFHGKVTQMISCGCHEIIIICRWNFFLDLPHQSERANQPTPNTKKKMRNIRNTHTWPKIESKFFFFRKPNQYQCVFISCNSICEFFISFHN